MTPLRIDLHVHSMHSGDGVMTPQQIIDRARGARLDGIAITDHDTTLGGIEARRLAPAGFLVIVGAEIMTDAGEVIGLFLEQDIEEHELARVTEAIRRQGGLVVVPHPFDSLRKSAFHIGDHQAAVIDAVEVFNSRCLLSRYNSRAREYALRHGLPGVAGSDAHYPVEIGNAGVVVEEGDVRESLRSGRFTTFGRRTPAVVHLQTKARKLAGRIR